MKENEVFWLGTRCRSGDQRSNYADEPEFVAAMQNACEAYGGVTQRFVSARGIYGTWILEFGRDGKNQRIVWNGKEGKLVLQVESTTGSWEEPKATSVRSVDIQGFDEGIRILIGPDAEPIA